MTSHVNNFTKEKVFLIFNAKNKNTRENIPAKTEINFLTPEIVNRRHHSNNEFMLYYPKYEMLVVEQY